MNRKCPNGSSWRCLLAMTAIAGLTLPSASASVITHADAGAGPVSTGPSGSGFIDGAGGAASFAEVRVLPTGAAFMDSGIVFFNCPFCGVGVAGASFASGDGLTGRLSTYTGSGLDPGFQGSAFARVTIEDTVTFQSPIVGVTLDTFYEAFFSGRPQSAGQFYDSTAFHQVTFQLSSFNEDGGLDPVYQAVIELHDSFVNLPAQVDGRSFTICEGVNAPCLPIASGTQFPGSNGHFSHSANLSGFVGVPLALFYQVQSSTSCKHGASDTCSSVASALNTSYLGLEGQFTSANGYGYLGVPAGSEVPEPSTCLSIGLACVVGGIWRRKSRG